MLRKFMSSSQSCRTLLHPEIGQGLFFHDSKVLNRAAAAEALKWVKNTSFEQAIKAQKVAATERLASLQNISSNAKSSDRFYGAHTATGVARAFNKPCKTAAVKQPDAIVPQGPKRHVSHSALKQACMKRNGPAIAPMIPMAPPIEMSLMDSKLIAQLGQKLRSRMEITDRLKSKKLSSRKKLGSRKKSPNKLSELKAKLGGVNGKY